ncbi:hypothetical protein [Ruminococcus sp.]|uniref:hypothetical protein n=1 Tax=Ruminococcus sp. TaxID=41978 RepID=UPI00258FB344|nr:hypothetical protein [Ruminococcus sp.]MCR5021097.1 hypothetical protein [Ruminococcus sp.]
MMNIKNVRLITEIDTDICGFNIFLDLSGGQKLFLMPHKKNEWLRKNIHGKRLDDIRRICSNKEKLIRPGLRHHRKTSANKLSSMLEHVIKVADFYLSELEIMDMMAA